MKKILLIFFSISIGICLFFIYKSYTSITNYVEIKTPYNRIIYSIEKDQIFTVDGHIGKLTIEIGPFFSSPCVVFIGFSLCGITLDGSSMCISIFSNCCGFSDVFPAQ